MPAPSVAVPLRWVARVARRGGFHTPKPRLFPTLSVAICLLPSLSSARPYKYLEALEYPDEERISPVYGTITYALTASGQHEEVEGKIRTTTTLNVTARRADTYHEQGRSYRVTVTGTGTAVTVDASGDRPETTTVTTIWSFSDSGMTPCEQPEDALTISVSESLGVANFGCDEFVIKPIKWHMEVTSSEGGRYSDDGEECALRARIPNYGAAGTPFASAARAAEAAGTDGGLPLGSGVIEAPWDGHGTHGQVSVSGLLESAAMGEGDLGDWNTEPAWRALGPDAISDFTFFPGTLQVSWSLGGKPAQGEMIIEPEEAKDYDEWIPSPADDEEGRYGPASEVLIIASIRAKEGEDEGEAPHGRIDFWLRDVSRHEGKCSNYPKYADEKDDLRFAEDQTDVIVDPQDPRHAYTEGHNLSEATVAVEATDTGAYGTLQATCDDLGLIAAYEPTGAQAIRIPRDDNNNHVADQWEKERDVLDRNYSATWDEDPFPSGQRRNGDGYTLYEEYRGFVTRNGFVRTLPLKKDLFVCDRDGLVKQYYEPYDPAKVELHYIDETMMWFSGEARNPLNRWVNFNSTEDTWYARQYALYVVEWGTMGSVIPQGEGLTLGQSAQLKRVFEVLDSLNETNTAHGVNSWDQPLKNFYVVEISRATEEKLVSVIADPNVRQAVFNADVISTVIHEIGHAIGIRHHRTPGPDRVETPVSQTEGVPSCAMRYCSDLEASHPELIKPQTRYCRAGETWKKVTETTDEDGNKSVTMEDVPSDDCFGQIDVKSDP